MCLFICDICYRRLESLINVCKILVAMLLESQISDVLTNNLPCCHRPVEVMCVLWGKMNHNAVKHFQSESLLAWGQLADVLHQILTGYHFFHKFVLPWTCQHNVKNILVFPYTFVWVVWVLIREPHLEVLGNQMKTRMSLRVKLILTMMFFYPCATYAVFGRYRHICWSEMC